MIGLGLSLDMPRSGAAAVGITVPSASLWLIDGDSISAQTDGRSIAAHLATKSGGLMNFAPNAYTPPADSLRPGTVGVSGMKIADQAANLTAMFAANPSVTHMVVHVGTNDMAPTLYATMQSDALNYLALCKTANVSVIWSCILRRNDAIGQDAGNELKRVNFNAWLATLVGNPTYSLIGVINHDANFDPAADPTLVNAADSLHPTYKGAGIFVGNIFAALHFTATDVAALLPANTITNATLTGTSGGLATGVTGQVPTSWTVDNDTGCTCVASVGVDTDGERYCDMVLTGSATTNGQNVRFFRNDTSVGLVAGEWAEGKMNVTLTGSGGSGDATGVTGWMVQISNGFTFNSSHSFAAYGMMNTAFAGDVRCIPLKAAGAVTGTIGAYAKLNVGVVDARFRIKKVQGGKGS
ncbi:MAG: hypothetical protein JWP35_4679 [Caulobacter sp.]|nr:hypothetical protein [Caulobacter sp.]